MPPSVRAQPVFIAYRIIALINPVVKTCNKLLAHLDKAETPDGRNTVRGFRYPTIYRIPHLLPGKRTSFSIVTGQKLQIKHVDNPVIVQIRGCRRRCVVVHPNRQGIKLIDHIVAINIACEQSNVRHRASASTCQRDRTLGAEETTSGSTHGVSPGWSRQGKCPISIGRHRRDQRVRYIIQTHGDRLARKHLSSDYPGGTRDGGWCGRSTGCGGCGRR